MVQPGKYEARVGDYGVKEVNGKPLIEIYFNIEDQGQVKWTGFMSTPKAVEITLKTLAICGFTSPNLEDIAQGPMGNALDMGSPVSVTVDFQKDREKKVTKYTHVTWVNPLQQAKFDPLVAQKMKSELSNLSGEWAKTRQKMNVKSKEEKVEVPF